MSLTIGKSGFTLPLDLVTATQAILARKRSGKSYTASVEAEEMLARGHQIVVFDPTSAWYGLRSSAEGTGPGYSIVIFGGDHADAPLDYRTGRSMAAAVVEHGFSVIFDIGSLHTEEQIQFVMDFASELLRINRNAMHVFMDEADTFAPQKTTGQLQQKCLGTVSRLVKQGGIKGVGFTMITQRPASINKDVLSQVDMLTILRMGHPLDIKAATDWLQSEVGTDFADTVKAALPSLPVGTAFICSAVWGMAERVEVRERRTFNSGATPKPGERRAQPSAAASIDIEKLGREIGESVERVRAESPEALKQRIADLETKLAKGGTVDMGFIEEAQAAQAELEELRPLREKHRRMVVGLALMSAEIEQAVASFQRLRERFDDMTEIGEGGDAPPPQSRSVSALPPVRTESTPAPVPAAAAQIRSTGDSPVNAPQQRILDAIATLHQVRGATVTLEWIACTAGTTPRARGFEENMRHLKAKGLVDGIRLTSSGAAIAHAEATPATWGGVITRLGAMLSVPQMNILRALKGQRMAAGALAAKVDTTERARGFEENTRHLRKRELIRYSGGTYTLVEWLEALR